MYEYLSVNECNMLLKTVSNEEQTRLLREFIKKHDEMVFAWETLVNSTSTPIYPLEYEYEGVKYKRLDDRREQTGDYMITFGYDDNLVLKQPYEIVNHSVSNQNKAVVINDTCLPINNLNAIAYERVSDDEEV